MYNDKLKKKIIIPTGYMGSGSSAITDLMSEFEGINTKSGSFEYVFMHCPNGIFDLEDKLLIGNNALRSDEALHSFAHTMKQLYNKKYWWVGHYEQNIGKDFWKVTCAYLEELTEFKTDYYWYYQENVEWRMIPRLIYNKMLKLLSHGRLEGKKALLYSPMWISYISKDRFYDATQKYIYKLLDMMGYDKGSIVIDQLLLPFNLHRINNYFKNDVEVFVVERDPRDVFILNKYFWPKCNETVPYPVEVKQFCEYYSKLRSMEKIVDSEHVHRVRFEDLIYNYEDTVKEIYKVLDIEPEKHIRKKQKFNPENSINNTQLFRENVEYQRESRVIEERLAEYLYVFPWEIKHKRERVF